ncbi:MAG: DNA mismatch repair endonuclease MutL [Rhodospirillales bacterium]|nr:DNA mismatch repair endonuclease MutL [Rhodospirillales bacterium]
MLYCGPTPESQAQVPPIRLLPETTVNRIAAGEVIERPAAAVKELVENALDAGATRIAVRLEGGGIERIEVIDNGAGIPEAELPLAVQRHATSKLADAQLVEIATLGFRGEALPSLGAAGRLTLTSRPAAAPHAATIRVEGGAVSDVMPAAGAPGTRAELRDLFFATPARRKFLKQPRTEAEHAEAALRRLAFAAPATAFLLEIDGRTVLDLPAQDRAARVAALLGADAAAALIAVDAARDGMRLSGFIANPAITRTTTAGQSFVVNARPVADPVLRTALRVAFRDVIAFGRHAVAALYLDLPAAEVDVNVHPAKTELRFRDAAGVRSLVIGTLGRALAGGAGSAVPAPRAMLAPPRPSYAPSYQWGARPPAPASSHAGWGVAEADGPVVLDLDAAPAARRLPTPAPPEADHPLGAPVAQVLDTYVIAVAADGSLVLVDQHAAHERLTHEALRTQMLAGGIARQALLLPAIVDLPAMDAARLLDHAADLAQLGLEIEAFGPGAIAVRALPAALGAPDPAPLLRDIADELAESGHALSLDARLDAIIARLACHGSIRAGRRLNAAEMDALLRQMEATPRAATCSHGRPTFLRLSRADIETLFGRR